MSDLEQRWQELGSFIRDQRRRGQLSLRKLSEMAGISNPYLSQIERGLRKPSAEILQQLARALEISSETLYVQAGILDAPTDDVDLPAQIRRDRFLDEEQKQTLVRIYQSFRQLNATDPAAPGAAAPARSGAPTPPVTSAPLGSGATSAPGATPKTAKAAKAASGAAATAVPIPAESDPAGGAVAPQPAPRRSPPAGSTAPASPAGPAGRSGEAPAPR